MIFVSEDITFCANFNCDDMDCVRNPKHIRLPILHSFCLFTKCEKWLYKGAEGLIEHFKDGKEE